MDVCGVREEALGGEVPAVRREVVALRGVDGRHALVVRAEEERHEEVREVRWARFYGLERRLERLRARLERDDRLCGVHRHRRRVGEQDRREGRRLVERGDVRGERGHGRSVVEGRHRFYLERGAQGRRARDKRRCGRGRSARPRRRPAPWAFWISECLFFLRVERRQRGQRGQRRTCGRRGRVNGARSVDGGMVRDALFLLSGVLGFYRCACLWCETHASLAQRLVGGAHNGCAGA